MPTYEYQCNDCGKTFEQFQRMSDAPLDSCPDCGGKVHRLMSAGVGMIFKGSGFHKTDYQPSGSSCGLDSPCCGGTCGIDPGDD